MSEPDWKTAPEGATHCSNEGKCYKHKDGKWYCFQINQKYWFSSSNPPDFAKLIAKPAPPAWHETGDLPPVGVECVFFRPDHICQSERSFLESETNVEILFHFFAHDQNVAAFKFTIDGETFIDYAIPCCFRPIQSDRDKAIEEMANIVRYEIPLDVVDAEACARAIYDAGFRKPDQDLKSQLENAEAIKGALVEAVNDLTRSVSQAFTNQPFTYSLQLSYDRATELLGNMDDNK